MSDRRLQELLRLWIASGDPADEAALLRERVRLGQLAERHVRLVPWLRDLSDQPATPWKLEEAQERLSEHEAFVLGYEFALGLAPHYRAGLSADLVAYRGHPSALPLSEDEFRAQYLQSAPGVRVHWDQVPWLLRTIASPPAAPKVPGVLSWALNLIPGMKTYRGRGALRHLWEHLVLYHCGSDRDQVWRSSILRLLEMISPSS